MSVTFDDLDNMYALRIRFSQAVRIDKYVYYLVNDELRRIISKNNDLNESESQVIQQQVVQICSDGKTLYSLCRDGDVHMMDPTPKKIITAKNLVQITSWSGVDATGKGFTWKNNYQPKMIYSHCKQISVCQDKIALITIGGKLMQYQGTELVQIPQINGLKVNVYFKKSILFPFGGLAIAENGDTYCFNSKLIKLRVHNLGDIGASSKYIFAVQDGRNILQWSIEEFEHHPFFANMGIFKKLNSGNEINIAFKKQSFKQVGVFCCDLMQYCFANVGEQQQSQPQQSILEKSISVCALDKTFCRESVTSLKQQLFEGWDQPKKRTLPSRQSLTQITERELSSNRGGEQSQENRESVGDQKLKAQQLLLQQQEQLHRMQTQEIQQREQYLIEQESIQKQQKQQQQQQLQQQQLQQQQQQVEIPTIQQNITQQPQQLQKQSVTIPKLQLPMSISETQEPVSVQNKLAKIREKLNMDPIVIQVTEEQQSTYSLYTLAEETSSDHSICNDDAKGIYDIQRKKYLVNDVFDEKVHVKPLHKKIESVKKQLNYKPAEVEQPMPQTRLSLEQILNKISISKPDKPIDSIIKEQEQSALEAPIVEMFPTFQNDDQISQEHKQPKPVRSFLKLDLSTKKKQSQPKISFDNEQSSVIDFQNASAFLDNQQDSFMHILDNNEKSNKEINLPMQLQSKPLATRLELIKQQYSARSSQHTTPNRNGDNPNSTPMKKRSLNKKPTVPSPINQKCPVQSPFKDTVVSAATPRKQQNHQFTFSIGNQQQNEPDKPVTLNAEFNYVSTESIKCDINTKNLIIEQPVDLPLKEMKIISPTNQQVSMHTFGSPANNDVINSKLNQENSRHNLENRIDRISQKIDKQQQLSRGESKIDYKPDCRLNTEQMNPQLSENIEGLLQFNVEQHERPLLNTYFLSVKHRSQYEPANTTYQPYNSVKLNQLTTHNTVEYSTNTISTDRIIEDCFSKIPRMEDNNNQSPRPPPNSKLQSEREGPFKKQTCDNSPIQKKRVPVQLPQASRSLIPPLNGSCRNSSQPKRSTSIMQPSVHVVGASCKPYQSLKQYSKNRNVEVNLKKVFFRLDIRVKLMMLEFMYNMKQCARK